MERQPPGPGSPERTSHAATLGSPRAGGDPTAVGAEGRSAESLPAAVQQPVVERATPALRELGHAGCADDEATADTAADSAGDKSRSPDRGGDADSRSCTANSVGHLLVQEAPQSEKKACGRGRGGGVRYAKLEDRRPKRQRREVGLTPAGGCVNAGLDAASVAGGGSSSSVAVPPGPPTALSSASAPTTGEEQFGLDDRQREAQRLQRELETLREQHTQLKKRFGAASTTLRQSKQALTTLLVQIAKTEDAEERDRTALATCQLGRCKQAMPPMGAHKATWEGGYEAEEIERVKNRIKDDRASIERLRRQLTKQGKARASTSGGTPAGGALGGGSAGVGAVGGAGICDDDRGLSGDEAEDLWEMREICQHRVAYLSREETTLREREQRLQVDRVLHLKRLRRLETADRSNFKSFPLLAEKYQLLNLIGRGGFSEVYRAYDLEGNRFCAVKIHELGKEMTDQQRQSYIRRAMREYDIQKTLKHPRVVTLQDCFPISTKAFGTVLELCEGETLDEYMKRHGALPEREARGIVIQILTGLKYMNTNGRKIIHYDLKPGNLFFHCGEVKIADFGLSKVVQESFGESIDLTSQGAGTYWYLPPECFVSAGQEEPPKISNKVDVWSTGVIFFELLFNRRPFGHGQSQEALLRTAMAGQAFAIEIPATPKVSHDGKEFLKKLLTSRREERPDVNEAHNDPYIRSVRARPPLVPSAAAAAVQPVAASPAVSAAGGGG